MPRFLVPKHTGAHRTAAFALYRALLAQCTHVSVPDEQRSTLRNAIRNKFRQNVNLQSPRLLQHAFDGGYQALDTLDAATSSEEHLSSPALHRITSALALLPSRLTKPITPPPDPRARSPPKKSDPHFTDPGAFLRSRPLPLSTIQGTDTTKKRKVPFLVAANSIPMLRFGKPQPQALSRYIFQRITRKGKRTDRKQALEGLLSIATMEDRWDQEVMARFGTPEGDGPPSNAHASGDRPPSNANASADGVQSLKAAMSGDGNHRGGHRQGNGRPGYGWRTEIRAAISEIHGYLIRSDEKNVWYAARMVEVLDREKEMAERERKDRKMKRNEERRARKAERDGAADVEGSDPGPGR